MSVCEIETSETYEKGRPKRGGLSDPRMGTMDRAMKCETDGMSSTDTPGYFGHLELAKPVYHHGFINNLVKVLRCVGFSSSKLLIDKVRAAVVVARGFPPPPLSIKAPPHHNPAPSGVSFAPESFFLGGGGGSDRTFPSCTDIRAGRAL
jgi:DNA-directed RNA polymerase beta' subunit